MIKNWMNAKIDSQYLMSEVFGLRGNEIDCPVIPEGVLEKALETLTEQEVDAIKCRFAERLSYRKIGERLGVSTSGAGNIVRAAMRRLRHSLRLGRFVGQVDSDDIGCLALSSRAENALRRAGMTISGIESTSDADLRKLRNLGTQTLREIRRQVIAFRNDHPFRVEVVQCSKCGRRILIEQVLIGVDHTSKTFANCWDCLDDKARERAKELYHMKTE